MIETIYAAIGIVGANIAFLVGYLGYILPETERCVEERKTMLDTRLKTKTDASVVGKTFEEIIVAGLGDLLYHVRETRQIEKWKEMFKQMKGYFIYSVILSLLAIVLELLTSQLEMLQNFYFPEALVVASVIYFGSFVYYSLNHRAALHKWKVSKKR